MADGDGAVAAKGKRGQNADGTVKETNKIQLSNVPPELMARIGTAAKEGDTTRPRFVLQMVADHFGVTLPPIVRIGARKYANEEERKAANAQRAKNKTAAVARLVKMAKAGEIELNPELKSLLGL